MTPIAEVKAAKKRAISMGGYSGWRPEYDDHPLAACMDNRTAIIDAEMEDDKTDYLFVLWELHAMAKKINAYCDSHKVDGDIAAQYWLERFLWRCDVVCRWDFLHSSAS
jgi:hypothetical protein